MIVDRWRNSSIETGIQAGKQLLFGWVGWLGQLATLAIAFRHN